MLVINAEEAELLPPVTYTPNPFITWEKSVLVIPVFVFMARSRVRLVVLFKTRGDSLVARLMVLQTPNVCPVINGTGSALTAAQSVPDVALVEVSPALYIHTLMVGAESLLSCVLLEM